MPLAGLVALVLVVSATSAPGAAQEPPASTTTTTAAPTTTTTQPVAPPTTQPGPDPTDPPPATDPVATAPVTSSVPASTAPLTTSQLAEARSQYAKLQKVADDASSEWERASDELDRVRTQMVTLELSTERARSEAEQARRLLGQRAVSAYKHGGAAQVADMLSSDSFTDLMTRDSYMRRVVEADRDLMRRALETRERVAAASDRLERQVELAQKAEDKLAELKHKVEDALEQQGFIVAKLVRQSHSDKVVGANEAASAMLDKVKVDVPRSDDMSVLPIVSPVGKVCPVGGPTTFSNDWHAPRVGHLHQGNDLFGQYGTPLVAIADGVIFKAGDDGGLGGSRVWLRDDDGVEYYYAHMARIDVVVGQRLTRGQQLGLLGNSGNAKTTPPHVHFEMHPGGGAAVNPYGTVIRLC